MSFVTRNQATLFLPEPLAGVVAHPRTADAARCRDAWELLREWHLDREVIIDTVTIVREDAHGWSAVERVLLG